MTVTATAPRVSTRTRMLISAAEVLRERGAAGVTIDEVLHRSGAPRGSVYHHFPDGRSQLIAEALQFAGAKITAVIDDAAGRGGISLVREFVDFWGRSLTGSQYHAGCPVVAAAVSPADDDTRLAEVAGDIFQRWRDALTRTFVGDGFSESAARSLAVTCIAALEGAVVLCRSTRSAAPLREVAEQIEFLIKARGFVGSVA
jgi:TetR/AcrR family transcriptional regulator, lmrAB and yxaGH operons repressor